MRRWTLTLIAACTAALTLPAGAHHYQTLVRDGVDTLRVEIPLKDRHYSHHETLKLKKLIRKRTGLNPNDYALRAVVLTAHTYRSGHAELNVNGYRSDRFYVPRAYAAGPQKVRIPSPYRGDYGVWHLNVGGDVAIDRLVAVLVPRSGRDYAYQPHYVTPWWLTSWSWNLDHDHGKHRHKHRPGHKHDHKYDHRYRHGHKQVPVVRDVNIHRDVKPIVVHVHDHDRNNDRKHDRGSQLRKSDRKDKRGKSDKRDKVRVVERVRVVEKVQVVDKDERDEAERKVRRVAGGAGAGFVALH